MIDDAGWYSFSGISDEKLTVLLYAPLTGWKFPVSLDDSGIQLIQDGLIPVHSSCTLRGLNPFSPETGLFEQAIAALEEGISYKVS